MNGGEGNSHILHSEGSEVQGARAMVRKGDLCWHSTCCADLQACLAEGSLGRCRSTHASAMAVLGPGQGWSLFQDQGTQAGRSREGCSPWPCDNMHISLDVPDLPQTQCYLSPSPESPSPSLCKCEMKAPCRYERITYLGDTSKTRDTDSILWLHTYYS